MQQNRDNRVFSEINNDELIVWIEVIGTDSVDKDGTVYPAIEDPAEALKFLTLINNMLTLRRAQSLLTRKRKLKDYYEDLIEVDLGLRMPGNRKQLVRQEHYADV
jgi:hypothetical protein